MKHVLLTSCIAVVFLFGIHTVFADPSDPVVVSFALSTSPTFTSTTASTISLNEGATTSVWAHLEFSDTDGCEDVLNTEDSGGSGASSDTIDVTFSLNYDGDGFTVDGSTYACPDTILATPTDGSLTDTCYADRVENSLHAGHEATAVSCTHTCTEGNQNAEVSCKFDLQHYATYNNFASKSMGAVVYVHDSMATTTATTSLPIEALTAVSISTTSLAYEDMSVSETSTEKIIIIRNTGNTAVDVRVAASPMGCNQIGTIPPAAFRMSSSSGFLYADGVSLSNAGVSMNKNVPKETTTSTMSTTSMYSLLVVPEGVSGTCTNQFTVSGIIND